MLADDPKKKDSGGLANAFGSSLAAKLKGKEEKKEVNPIMNSLDE